jgi:hypothetical protein
MGSKNSAEETGFFLKEDLYRLDLHEREEE